MIDTSPSPAATQVAHDGSPGIVNDGKIEAVCVVGVTVGASETRTGAAPVVGFALATA
jgi:hypothetical protein